MGFLGNVRRTGAALVGAGLLSASLVLGGGIPAFAANSGPCGGTARIVGTRSGWTYTAKNCFPATKRIKAVVYLDGTAYVGKCVSLAPGKSTSVTGTPKRGVFVHQYKGTWQWC